MALIVRNNEVIASCHNSVTRNKDPTAHTEVTAIRKACEKLDQTSLSECETYASCEPCPMCFGAIFSPKSRGWYTGRAEVAVAAGFSKYIADASLVIDMYLKNGLDIKQPQPRLAAGRAGFREYQGQVTQMKL